MRLRRRRADEERPVERSRSRETEERPVERGNGSGEREPVEGATAERRYGREPEERPLARTRYAADSEPIGEGSVDEASETEVVERDTPATPARALASSVLMLSAWVGIAGLLTLAILGLRLGFQMSDANPKTGFVDFIYRISGPLIQPFQGIMRIRQLDSGGFFDPATAYAMGIYVIATLFVMLMLWAVIPRWIGGERTVVRRSRVAHQH